MCELHVSYMFAGLLDSSNDAKLLDGCLEILYVIIKVLNAIEMFGALIFLLFCRFDYFMIKILIHPSLSMSKP